MYNSIYLPIATKKDKHCNSIGIPKRWFKITYQFSSHVCVCVYAYTCIYEKLETQIRLELFSLV